MIKKILPFLRNRPALKIYQIENETGCPRNTLGNAMNGAQGKVFPEKWIWPLCVTLCRYGLEIAGWRFVYDTDIHSLLIEKPVEDAEVEFIEHESPTGGVWIEHRVPMHRALLTDEYELFQFLQNVKI